MLRQVILLLFMVLTVLFNQNNEVKAATFTDITIDYWARAEIEYLSNKKIINGIGNGSFNPEGKLTRGHIALMVYRERQYPQNSLQAAPIKDINFEGNNELYQAVQALYSQEIINHLVEDNKFYPNLEITRSEMASILVKAYNLTNEMDLPKEFTDVSENNWAYSFVQALYANGITTGISENQFGPDTKVTRAQFSAFMARVLDENFMKKGFQIGQINDQTIYLLEKKYASIDDAMKVVKKDGTEVILLNNRIVWVQEGFATGIGKDVIKIYLDSALTKYHTYIPPNYEMEYIGNFNGAVKVKISGLEGYVSPVRVKLKPKTFMSHRNYYQVEGEDLKLFLYYKGTHYRHFFGEPLEGMIEGKAYYSNDGIQFEHGQKVHQYFQFLPLRTVTEYTAEELDKYVAMGDADSPLIGMGKAFKKAEKEFKVNAMYMLAHAIVESDWGESDIARKKNNIFGLNAIDITPGESAKSFGSIEECIMYFGKYVSDKYLTPGEGSRGIYHGAYLGNKYSGLNVMYASDPYWGQKIAGRMYRIDKLLGGKERNKYKLALVKSDAEFLNVRRTPSEIEFSAIYKYQKNGMAMAILMENINSGSWHQIVSENPEYEYAFIHGDYVEFITTP